MTDKYTISWSVKRSHFYVMKDAEIVYRNSSIAKLETYLRTQANGHKIKLETQLTGLAKRLEDVIEK